jgi:hypothetical protein
MRQLEYIQVLYAFHFHFLPKNEHDTRARFLPRSLEFPKRRNDIAVLLLLVIPRHVVSCRAGSWKLRLATQVLTEANPLGRCLEQRVG